MQSKDNLKARDNLDGLMVILVKMSGLEAGEIALLEKEIEISVDKSIGERARMWYLNVMITFSQGKNYNII